MRVLVVDDHEVVRRGVRSLLSQSNYDVCGEAMDGSDALEKARQLKPDVIVMDVSMPNLNGLEATRLIRKEVPGSEVLIMSQHDSPAMIREAFKAGARGYVVKSSMGKDLLVALDKVSRHTSFFDPAITEITIDLARLMLRKFCSRARPWRRLCERARNCIAPHLIWRRWELRMSAPMANGCA
jgi:DNA-binding NarL/FixJ family response regulator